MSPTAFPPESRDCESVGELLSWYANGTLGAADRAVVDSHIAFCDTCRTTLAVERRIVESMRAPRDNVEQSPHAGWQKLAARLDSEDATALDDAVDLDSHTATLAPMPANVAALAKAGRKGPRRVNWPAALVVAVAVQAAAIAVLTVALLRHRQVEEAPRYHTVAEADPTLGAHGSLVRIAFDASIDDAAARRVAEQATARILAGPSPDNVYTFVFPEGQDARKGQDDAATLDDRVSELRRQAHVLLVEPVVLGEPRKR
jgi:hypothetical protein